MPTEFVTVHPAMVTPFTDIDQSMWTAPVTDFHLSATDGDGYEFNSDVQPGNVGIDANLTCAFPSVIHPGTLLSVTVVFINTVGNRGTLAVYVSGIRVRWVEENSASLTPGVDGTAAQLQTQLSAKVAVAGPNPDAPDTNFLLANGTLIDEVRATYAFDVPVVPSVLTLVGEPEEPLFYPIQDET